MTTPGHRTASFKLTVGSKRMDLSVDHHSTNEVDEGTSARISGAWPVKPSFTTTETPSPTPAPVFEPGNAEWLKYQDERAERHIILGRIQAHLEAEPSPRAIRASVRRWTRYITVMGEAVATEREAS